MNRIKCTVFIIVIIGAIVFHEKFKDSKLFQNNFLKILAVIIIVFILIRDYDNDILS